MNIFNDYHPMLEVAEIEAAKTLIRVLEVEYPKVVKSARDELNARREFLPGCHELGQEDEYREVGWNARDLADLVRQGIMDLPLNNDIELLS